MRPDRNEDKLTLCRLKAPSAYLSQIGPDDADAAFFREASEDGEGFFAVFCGDRPVGLAQALDGANAFLYLYLFPAHRSEGYARAALALLEQRLLAAGANRITTCYRAGDARAAAFAAQNGYRRKFSSDLLRYTEPRPDVQAAPVRVYRDADYPQAHALYAEAFHRMRLQTGCFPDSVPEPPSEQMRMHWADTARERFVYVYGGEIAGYAHVQGSELDSVAVRPSRQGNGIGRRFVQYLIGRILAEGHAAVDLFCVVGNDRARRLYDALGFIEVCRSDYAEKTV